MSADSVIFSVAWFENAGDKGKPALGDPERTVWDELVSIYGGRREGGLCG
jgi:hypothetical protein